MRSTIKKVDPSWPIVETINGTPTPAMALFLLESQTFSLLIGQGSPEGVVEAVQGVEYMDENGTAGSIKYIKQLSNISGDRTRGWVAIG